MQKHLLYIPLIALSSALALTACSDEVTNTLTPDLPIGEKTPIELSVGGVDSPNAATRAVITDGTGKTLNAFDKDTKIFMVMKSEYDTDHPDFAGAQNTKYNVARGDVAVSKNDATNNWSIVDFDAKNQRYWDDAHARSSMLSIWAYAQMGQSWYNCTFNGIEYKTATDETQPYAWTETEIIPTILTWRASHQAGTDAQNQQSVLAQDLLFSNNLADNGTDKDKRLQFDFSTRKFPKLGEANMIFYHAMSKITINIKEGDGFDAVSTTDFQFKSNTNVQLNGFNVSGRFDIKQGEFLETVSNSIPSIYNKGFADGKYILEALVVPGTNLYNSSVPNAFDFIIDNNQYKISAKTLAEAIRAWKDADENTPNASFTALEAGKHYIFTFTVGKTQIKNITAQVADWENVLADDTDASNARIKLNLEERGSDLTSSDRFSFYRAEKNNTGEINDDYTTYDWKTGYSGNVISPTYVAASGTTPAHWTTSWFWNNSLNYYHFRALAKMNGTAKVAVEDNVVTDATNGDYLALNHAETSYTDILWGAPMTDYAQNEVSDAENLKWNYGPTANGFDGLDTKATDAHQIYKAIGPTKDAIKLILFHMMSDVTFKIKTTTEADKVNLGNGTTEKTTIKLENIHQKGNLYMGNGLVKGSDTPSDFEFTPSSSAPDANGFLTWPNYGAIPQSLDNAIDNDLDNVKLYITTPDNNQYIVDLKDVLANSVNTNNIANPYDKVGGTGADKDKYKINRWYPGFKYTYTFTLKKTGITDLQVTILDWETVEAENQDVVIQ